MRCTPSFILLTQKLITLMTITKRSFVIETAIPWQKLASVGRWAHHFIGAKPATYRPLFDATRLSALAGRLEIVRDANGVAHLYAEHDLDLFAALGFLQGCERGLHLEFLRHLARGRLGEWLTGARLPSWWPRLSGFSLIDVDRFVRPLGFEGEARAALARIPSVERHYLSAFARGVNDAWRGELYGPEQVLFAKTQPWRAEDCLLAARASAFIIALLPLENELTFNRIRGEQGDALARLLYPDAPWDAAPPRVSDGAAPSVQERAGGGGALSDNDGPELPLEPLPMGSNNWAVAGSRTQSGKPLLANDPHVPLLPAPTFWQHVHLKSPTLNVQGGMYPGFPAFGFGHNAQLAWGVTTAFRDAWDLFRIERLPGAPSRYRIPAGVGELVSHKEVLYGRWSAKESVEWESCAHGVVYPHWKSAMGGEVALKYAECDHVAHFSGHLALMRAKTTEALDAALASINEGPFDFNVVHAHHEGRIGWSVVGKLPKRMQDGLFERDAKDKNAQWDGYLPFSENPAQIQPECGFVGTANSVTDAAQHARLCTPVHCEAEYRQQRIVGWLSQGKQLSVLDMQRMQADVGADFSEPLRDVLCANLEAYHAGTRLQQDAVRALRDWDGVFDVDSVGASVFSFLRRRIASDIFAELLPEKIAFRFGHGQRAIPRLDRLLLDDQDDLRGYLEAKTGLTLSRWIRVSFEKMLAEMASQFGGVVATWRWGRIQVLRIAAAAGELVPAAHAFTALEVGFPGENNTLSPAISMPLNNGGLRVLNGASSRFICDLSAPHGAWFAHCCGPSADPDTPYFRGLAQQWADFRWFWSGLWPADEVPDVLERVVVGFAELSVDRA
ncbi:Putative penicillin amidase, Peptidase S45 [gamma proteobacterium HdN1]|nr:Putative penicillin amidase, Peptidase S45 [gamma proteobacterium HdN1]